MCISCHMKNKRAAALAGDCVFNYNEQMSHLIGNNYTSVDIFTKQEGTNR